MDTKELVKVLKASNYKTFEIVSSSLSARDEFGLYIHLKTIILAKNTGIIIKFLEANGGISNEIIIESICKNIEVDDERFDEIIPELRDISYQILEFILNDYKFKNMITEEDKIVQMDCLISVKPNFCFDIKLFIDLVEQLVNKIEKRDIDYSNYNESLILLGSIGKSAATILEEVGIADYKCSYGGYLLTFKSEKMTMSNTAIAEFRELLSTIGIPVFATIIDFMHHLW